MDSDPLKTPSRRALLTKIGAGVGGAAVYRLMTSLGFASESTYRGPVRLDGDPRGASVLVIGAGLAGMTAAYELRRAGYTVQVLEYNARPGGRNWTVRGGDAYVELGGARQVCRFDKGQYLNPGPWRIPHHHYAVLDYCRRLGVALEPFVQLNHNAYFHKSGAFGGVPQRIREIKADFSGGVAELLAKATHKGALDDDVTKMDREILLEALRQLGGLDRDYRYRAGPNASEFRGYKRPPGGGLSARPADGEPVGLGDILSSRLWEGLQSFLAYDFQTTMFQPVGGMGGIGEAFGRELADAIRYNVKVVEIAQDDGGVEARFEDMGAGGARATARADWCVCTLPLSILSRMSVQVGAPLREAISALPYAPAVKVGLQFSRRFWEEDEHIYGGISYTDQSIRQIGYPNYGFNRQGKGVLLGAYLFGGANAYEFSAMSPADRVKAALEQGAAVHPQYRDAFETGFSVAWARVPFTLGCAADWTDALRAQHYDNLCAIDGRIALAGEHASYIPAWQEGAILSALDCVQRLHARVIAP
jgi:monoamine oxidase